MSRFKKVPNLAKAVVHAEANYQSYCTLRVASGDAFICYGKRKPCCVVKVDGRVIMRV